jgi:hypothetical protein
MDGSVRSHTPGHAPEVTPRLPKFVHTVPVIICESDLASLPIASAGSQGRWRVRIARLRASVVAVSSLSAGPVAGRRRSRRFGWQRGEEPFEREEALRVVPRVGRGRVRALDRGPAVGLVGVHDSEPPHRRAGVSAPNSITSPAASSIGRRQPRRDGSGSQSARAHPDPARSSGQIVATHTDLHPLVSIGSLLQRPVTGGGLSRVPGPPITTSGRRSQPMSASPVPVVAMRSMRARTDRFLLMGSTTVLIRSKASHNASSASRRTAASGARYFRSAVAIFSSTWTSPTLGTGERVATVAAAVSTRTTVPSGSCRSATPFRSRIRLISLLQRARPARRSNV